MADSLHRSAELLLSFKNSAKKSDAAVLSFVVNEEVRATRSSKKRLFDATQSEGELVIKSSSSSTSPASNVLSKADSSDSSSSDDGTVSESEQEQIGSKAEESNGENSRLNSLPQSSWDPVNTIETADHLRREFYSRYDHATVQLPASLRDSLRQLKNLLKLPKARQFVCAEFFYSDVDRELFLSDNEFRLCLRESFPNLKTRLLSRFEWRRIRSSIGKPRRCSQAFFDEERQILTQKRQRIRDIYKGTALSLEADLELPPKIPHPLVVGSRVAVRLCRPKDGVFTGTVDAVMDGKYRVFFERDLLPALVVDDYDIKSIDSSNDNLAPISFFIEKNKAAQPLTFRCGSGLTFGTPTKFFGGTTQAPLSNVSENSSSNFLTNDPLLPRPSSSLSVEEKCGHYPLKSIITLVRLSKLIENKRCLLVKLQQMNAEAERIHLYAEHYVHEFQQQYAKIIIELDQANKRIDSMKAELDDFVRKVAPHLTDPVAVFSGDEIKKTCLSVASCMVKRSFADNLRVKDKSTVELIVSLTSLLLHVRSLGQQFQQQQSYGWRPVTQFDLKSLTEVVNEIKCKIDPSLLRDFEDNVEVHFKHVEQTMLENLYSSSVSNV